MREHNAAIQTNFTTETLVTGSGQHVARTYPKKAGVVIPAGGVVAMDGGEAVEFDPAGELPVKGVAILKADEDDVSVSLCVFGSVRRHLLTVKGGAAPNAAALEKLEERHIYGA
jgi:hypothetical protein